jgi:putative ATPase
MSTGRPAMAARPSSSSAFVACPVCSKKVASALINEHLNSCLQDAPSDAAAPPPSPAAAASAPIAASSAKRRGPVPPAAQPQGRQDHQQDRQQDGRPAKVARRSAATSSAPLAERMRPRDLSEFRGQTDALATFAPLLADGTLPSLVLWGPPGCGKTSFAAVVEQQATGCIFKRLSAVTCGVADVRQCVEAAAGALRLTQRRTILFLDEIHRFNKGQQDAVSPSVCALRMA